MMFLLKLHKVIGKPVALFEGDCLSKDFWTFSNFFELSNWVEENWGYVPEIQYSYSNTDGPEGPVINDVFEVIELSEYGDGGRVIGIIYVEQIPVVHNI